MFLNKKRLVLWDSSGNVDFPKRDVISLKCYLRVQCWLRLICVAFISKVRIPAREVKCPLQSLVAVTAPAAGLQSSPWRGNASTCEWNCSWSGRRTGSAMADMVNLSGSGVWWCVVCQQYGKTRPTDAKKHLPLRTNSLRGIRGVTNIWKKTKRVKSHKRFSFGALNT